MASTAWQQTNKTKEEFENHLPPSHFQHLRNAYTRTQWTICIQWCTKLNHDSLEKFSNVFFFFFAIFFVFSFCFLYPPGSFIYYKYLTRTTMKRDLRPSRHYHHHTDFVPMHPLKGVALCYTVRNYSFFRISSFSSKHICISQ